MQRPLAIFTAAVLAALATGIPASAQPTPSKPANYSENSGVCRQAIRDTERALRLPIGIMQAISMAHGKGRFYPDKATAIAAVRKLQAGGLKNIDVGCMQVNLKYHPKAFSNLEAAFDPATNARYAAGLFARLRTANKSIMRAVAHYHSTTRARNRPYTKKVMRLWNQERRRYFAEEREKKIAAWRAAREERKAAKLARQRAAGTATVASAGSR